jgi:hypothetical protein
MKMEKLEPILRALELGERRVIYTSASGVEISTTRTDKICPHDFAVGLTIPGRAEFYPTHVRLLFDLYLKRLSNKENADELFRAIEKVCDGADPREIAPSVLKLKFPMQLDDPDVNLFYAQLLMIEQEFNYGPQGCKKGKVHPPKEFLMRFIRWVASGEDEIDKIITNAVRNWSPPERSSIVNKLT